MPAIKLCHLAALCYYSTHSQSFEQIGQKLIQSIVPPPYLQNLPRPQTGMAILAATLAMGWTGCSSPSQTHMAGPIEREFPNTSAAPIVGALYQGQIPGLGTEVKGPV